MVCASGSTFSSNSAVWARCSGSSRARLPTHRGPRRAGGSGAPRGVEERPGARGRPHGLRQVNHVGGDHPPDQPHLGPTHRHTSRTRSRWCTGAKKSLVNQREIHTHTWRAWRKALRGNLAPGSRRDPDRRDARLADDLLRGHRRGDRSPGLRHDPHGVGGRSPSIVSSTPFRRASTTKSASLIAGSLNAVICQNLLPRRDTT